MYHGRSKHLKFTPRLIYLFFSIDLCSTYLDRFVLTIARCVAQRTQLKFSLASSAAFL